MVAQDQIQKKWQIFNVLATQERCLPKLWLFSPRYCSNYFLEIGRDVNTLIYLYTYGRMSFIWSIVLTLMPPINFWFSDVSRGCRKRPVAWNRLIVFDILTTTLSFCMSDDLEALWSWRDKNKTKLIFVFLKLTITWDSHMYFIGYED